MSVFCNKSLLAVCMILVIDVSVALKPVIVIASGGATFPLDIYKIWRPMYLSHRAENAEIAMTYNGVGSGTGIKRFFDKTYDFAGSDIVLPESSYDNGDDIQMFPTMAGPISISYNIPDLPQTCNDYSIPNNPNCLNLTREAIIGIFNGSIQQWNHPLIVENNHVLRDVNASITVVVRFDKSGTTELFTSALCGFSSQWKHTYGSFSEGCTSRDRPIKWNSDIKIQCGATSFGAIGLMVNTPYSIGYCATSEARDSSLPDARILNRASRWVKPSVDTTLAAMDSFADALGPRLTGSIIDAPTENAYPIVGYTYFLIKKRSMTNCTVAQELLRFFTFVLTSSLAKTVARDFVKAPVSDRVLGLIYNQVFSKFECGGAKVTELVNVAMLTETGAYDLWKVPVGVCLGILVIVAIIMGIAYGYVNYVSNQSVLNGDYILQLDSLEASNANFLGRTEDSCASGLSHTSIVRSTSGEQYMTRMLCKHCDGENLRWETKKLLVRMKNDIHHPNILKISGIGKRDRDWKIVTSWPRMGRLQDIIHSGKYNLNLGVRYSIVSDVADGMAYLHKNDLLHGQLTSSSCYIDGRWNCQVGEWEHHALHRTQIAHFTAFEFTYESLYKNYPTNMESLNNYCRLLYFSPSELLQQDQKNLFYVNKATKMADVFSFGVVAYEVFTSIAPFENLLTDGNVKWQPLSVLTAIKFKHLRPTIAADMRLDVPLIAELIGKTWAVEPSDRPTFSEIVKTIKVANPKSESVVDTMMQAVESHAVRLEEKVTEMKNLLNNMLPASAAEKLSRGEHVEPELYQSVTIIFTDIVGFTSLAAMSSPIQIVRLLNDLYTTFDSVISNYDVYKVETIGDSYMCVSGLPNRNGISHAAEIATMALDILSVVRTIPISHMPDKVLLVRAGVHSGGVMAGVVGLKMPRFCLFGDTVNTAARMESSSLPMRIQISEATKSLLDIFQVYHIHLRGTREVKGKGLMTTYWLTGKDGYTKELPAFDSNDDEELTSMLDSSQIK